MPNFTGVSHVELTVRDADRSAAWYEKVLCMTVLEFPEYATPGVSARVVQVINLGAGLSFGLIQDDSGEDGEFSEFRVGLDHLALAVDSRDELESWAAHLDACGVPYSGIGDHPYGSLLVFRDPDNIQLELFVLASNYSLDPADAAP
jgi:catechol 2,3-dioxygenase-like lactoylglutathione lyase family enzyme